MNDYIKREDALNSAICLYTHWIDVSDNQAKDKYYAEGRTIIDTINQISSADVVKRKNGQWLYMDSDSRFPWRCSECGCASITTHSIFRHPTERFCSNCGAQMNKRSK